LRNSGHCGDGSGAVRSSASATWNSNSGSNGDSSERACDRARGVVFWLWAIGNEAWVLGNVGRADALKVGCCGSDIRGRGSVSLKTVENEGGEVGRWAEALNIRVRRAGRWQPGVEALRKDLRAVWC